MDQSKPLRVVGVFRSGTNLLKYLLEENFEVNVSFSDRWWKHQIIPTEFSPAEREVTLVVIKNPWHQLYSWFEYSKDHARTFTGASHFREFIRRPIRISQNHQKYPTYLFKSPVEYYNQFYFTAWDLEKKTKRYHLVRYEDIVNNTRDALSGLAEKILVEPRAGAVMELPSQRLKNLKGWEQAGGDSLRNEDFDIEFVRSRKYLDGFGGDDRRFVRRTVHRGILKLFSDFEPKVQTPEMSEGS